MRLFFVVLILFLGSFPSSSQQAQNKTKQPQQATPADKRGTQESPAVVKLIPPDKTPEEAARDKKDREEKTVHDRDLVDLTCALALIAALQLIVYSYQAYKLRQTVKAAGEQSEAMDRHIVQATRSADAMERVATTIKDGNKAVTRAYLTVTVGGKSAYQQRRLPEEGGDIRFEASVNLVNTGMTPARKVRIRKVADILPSPLPSDFSFPLPEDKPADADGTVGAHLTYIISVVVDDLIPEDQVQTVKEAVDRALYVWGVVTYEDMFGDTHITKFGQRLMWLRNDMVYAIYIPGQNDSD
jgi:Tfp pilus assembly protein PilE